MYMLCVCTYVHAALFVIMSYRGFMPQYSFYLFCFLFQSYIPGGARKRDCIINFLFRIAESGEISIFFFFFFFLNQ